LQSDAYTEAHLLASPAPGTYIGASRVKPPRGYLVGRPVVATSYFYWYDDASGEHFRNADGSDALTDHPANPVGYSYKRKEWHLRELRDVMDAGIDVVLPVYWGSPADRGTSSPFRFSYAGIPPLVAAAQALEREGRRPPRIGLFYDTSTLQANAAHRRIDLTTRDGKAWFYVTIRDFFSMVPSRLWACIEGRPIVFLYAAGFAARGTDDPGLLPYVSERFRRDFGTTPYIVAEVSWRLKADSTYAWGACFGASALGAAAVGPGFDNRAVPGSTGTPRQDREGGAFYRRNWEKLLAMSPRRRPALVHVETWNELHEATDVAHSREHGRQYIEVTRRYADQWRAGKQIRLAGTWADAREVSLVYAPVAQEKGIRWIEQPDGQGRIEGEGADRCLAATANPIGPARYLYFNVDDSFYFDGDGALEVAIEYRGDGPPPFTLEYDSADASAVMSGSYKGAWSPEVSGSGPWRRAAYRLRDPRFVGRQNGGADLRLCATGDFRVRSLTVRKR